MPHVDADGCRLHYSVDGPDDGPALLLSNALGTTTALWDRQHGAFAGRFRVIRYDTRGHGGSDVPAGEYTIGQLGRDALAVLDAAGVERAHVCGISLGGMTAMWLAVHAPDRVGRLVLANTAARIGSREGWQERIDQVRQRGLSGVAAAAPARWFSDEFIRRCPSVVSQFQAMLTSCPADGYAACAAVLRDADLWELVPAIAAPALVVVGQGDPLTPAEQGRWLRDRIAGAQLLALAARHFANVETGDAFTRPVLEFLAG